MSVFESPRFASWDPEVNRSASSALRMRCVWPKRPGLTWLRLRRTLSRPSQSSWITASTSTKPPKKARDARRNQANTQLKEIRFRLKIDDHDFGVKKGHVERFLSAGDKVKVMIMFRGREQSRPEAGVRLLQRLAERSVTSPPSSRCPVRTGAT